MKTLWLITVMTGWVGIISVHAADNMKAFPPAASGMVRWPGTGSGFDILTLRHDPTSLAAHGPSSSRVCAWVG